jgi:glycosyltransferase involved in cell wall biosynthesis
VTVVLYRPSLDARSGAGQLIEMQWRGLSAAGIDTIVAAERGALKFWLRTGVRARRRSLAGLDFLKREQRATIVDHGFAVRGADLLFVHNLAGEVRRHLGGGDLDAHEDHERRSLEQLDQTATVVANSRLVANALAERYGVARARIEVLHPGFRSGRFTPQGAAALRDSARAELGVAGAAPLVGLVTSGDFRKRGLDVFLDSAARIAAQRADVRFLIVGSKRLPEAALSHELVRRGVVLHRGKSSRPERWFAALDLFLYTARYEEFGMVVSEAQAIGLPVLTSRVVGASECLPADYARWILERPDAAQFATSALTLLDDAVLRGELGAAGAASIASFNERAYVAGTLDLLAAQKRRVK